MLCCLQNELVLGIKAQGVVGLQAGALQPGLLPVTSAFSHVIPFSFQASHEAGHGCAAPAGRAPRSVFPPLGGRGESALCQAVEHMKHTPQQLWG